MVLRADVLRHPFWATMTLPRRWPLSQPLSGTQCSHNRQSWEKHLPETVENVARGLYSRVKPVLLELASITNIPAIRGELFAK